MTVLFSDLVGFTEISARLPTADLIDELNDLFSRFDEIGEKLGVEKIKTIGDAYLAVGASMAIGRPSRRSRTWHWRWASFAVRALRRRWQIRIGLNCGPVVAGVIGTTKFTYDLWGDAVNVASRLEASRCPGASTYRTHLAAALSDRYRLEPRGARGDQGERGQ